MALLFHRDGSIDFLSDANDGAIQTIARGTPEVVWVPQYQTFQAAHPAPAISSPAPTAQLVILPSVNPGVTGGLWLDKGTTLQVSLGPLTSAQIGATGATGLTGISLPIGPS